jgi:hypothetical protein
MKIIWQLKEIGCRIASGLTTAVAFIAITGILIVSIGFLGSRIPWMGGRIQSWILNAPTNSEILIALGTLGFALGMLFDKFFPGNTRKHFVHGILFGTPVILVLWFMNDYISHIPAINSRKLIDCSKNDITLHLKVPKGKYFRLDLKAPPDLANDVKAQINILSGTTTVTNFQIGSKRSEVQCPFFLAESNYEIEVFFDGNIPSGTSLWLRWLQTSKERER